MTDRYLHVIQSLDPRGGGPAEAVKQLSKAAANLGHQVEIATLRHPSADWVREYPCPVHFVGPSYLNYGYAPRFGPWLRANAARFDAVIVNGIWQYQSLCTWSVLRGREVPYYVFTHGMLDPWFKQQYPLKHLKKSLYWPWAEYRVLRDARAVLFTCEEERRLARESFALYRANERIVSLGVPEPPGDARGQREAFFGRFPQLRGVRYLLFLGRIHPKKGCDLLIEAFAASRSRDPALQLVIAGPDQVGIQQALANRAARLGIAEAITWTGMLQGDEKLGAFRGAEAFVLPSHQENFGIAVAEALSCAIPVLISKKVNIWREVVADRAGLAADDTLAGANELLQNWAALAPEERRMLGRNAYESYRSRFSLQAAAISLHEAIELQTTAPWPAIA